MSRGASICAPASARRAFPCLPNSLILPYTGSLSPDLVDAAVGLLGQAWSVATAPAGALPADVPDIDKGTVTDRAYDLSEAGLRILIGDTQAKALEDFTFDFFGSDRADGAFDHLRRASTQGKKLSQALAARFEQEIENTGLLDFQSGFARKVSYRPGHLSVITGAAPVRVRLSDASGQRLGGLSEADTFREIPYGDQLLLSDSGSARSTLTLVTRLYSQRYDLDLSAEAATPLELGIVLPDASGTLHQWRFSGVTLAAGARASAQLVPGGAAPALAIDGDGDGSVDAPWLPAPSSPSPTRRRRSSPPPRSSPASAPAATSTAATSRCSSTRRSTAASAQDVSQLWGRRQPGQERHLAAGRPHGLFAAARRHRPLLRTAS